MDATDILTARKPVQQPGLLVDFPIKTDELARLRSLLPDVDVATVNQLQLSVLDSLPRTLYPAAHAAGYGVLTTTNSLGNDIKAVQLATAISAKLILITDYDKEWLIRFSANIKAIKNYLASDSTSFLISDRDALKLDNVKQKSVAQGNCRLHRKIAAQGIVLDKPLFEQEFLRGKSILDEILPLPNGKPTLILDENCNMPELVAFIESSLPDVNIHSISDKHPLAGFCDEVLFPLLAACNTTLLTADAAAIKIYQASQNTLYADTRAIIIHSNARSIDIFENCLTANQQQLINYCHTPPGQPYWLMMTETGIQTIYAANSVRPKYGPTLQL